MTLIIEALVFIGFFVGINIFCMGAACVSSGILGLFVLVVSRGWVQQWVDWMLGVGKMSWFWVGPNRTGGRGRLGTPDTPTGLRGCVSGACGTVAETFWVALNHRMSGRCPVAWFTGWWAGGGPGEGDWPHPSSLRGPGLGVRSLSGNSQLSSMSLGGWIPGDEGGGDNGWHEILPPWSFKLLVCCSCNE